MAGGAARLGMSTHSLYAWVKRYSKPEKQRVQEDEQQAELRRLRAELKRVTEERDILKKAAVSSTGECNILHLSQNWAFTHGNDEGARVLSFTKARALA